ncbi:MAG TPA: class I SAM-dependent methyltransferase [Streptosporangiaceae bacterium]|jgi:SAM-dependent methyltransferase|nr:class I SAM-dependent methyltransferase [Streptosporangiaceae bacterium]
MDVLRQHEIAEAGHRILNPFTDEKLALVGKLCRWRRGQRLLDLASGKGEMLCTWARRHGIQGVGVDLSDVFVPAARARAAELGVADRVAFVRGEASAFEVEPGSFDAVACIGATWIGGGLAGTADLMRPALAPGGLLLIGEPFWWEEPPGEAHAALALGAEEFTSLPGTLDRFEAAGLELLEMVLADEDSWDRYVASQWWTVTRWLDDHPDHPDAPEMRGYLDRSRRSHLTYRRRYLGWGVFVLRPAS